MRLHTGCVSQQLQTMVDRGLQAASVERLIFFESDPEAPTHSWTLSYEEGISTLDHAMATFRVPASHGNYLYSRRLFQATGYDPSLGAMDAWSFGIRHLLLGFPVAIAESALYFHRVGHDSYWTREQQGGRNNRNAVLALRKNIELFPVPLQSRIGRIKDEEPIFDYVEAGYFRRDSSLPPLISRGAQRTIIGAAEAGKRIVGLVRSVRGRVLSH